MTATDRLAGLFRVRLEALIAPAGPKDGGARIGVAVSGGGDSMALLAMAARTGRHLEAATVDHGLRPEAAGEAARVAAFCGRAGLRHDILRLSGLMPGPNLAARARVARYGALAGWAADRGLASVLLGHTADDQAETVLLRLARGSGADGLAAMAPARRWSGIDWLRPLLDFGRDELRDWLRANAVGWADDSTNDDPAHRRVRARRALEVLAPLGLTRARLTATARLLARQRAVLEAAGADLARAAVRPGALGEVLLDPGALRSALADTALRVLAGVLMEVSGARYRPRLRALESTLARISAPNFRGATLAGCALVGHRGAVVVCREPAALPVQALRAGSQDWDGRWRIDGAPGLWAAPLGEAGLQRATWALRRADHAPPAAWTAAARAARRAVPAIYGAEAALPDDLAAVPSAGLVLDGAAAGVSIAPPDGARVRHRGPE